MLQHIFYKCTYTHVTINHFLTHTQKSSVHDLGRSICRLCQKLTIIFIGTLSFVYNHQKIRIIVFLLPQNEPFISTVAPLPWSPPFFAAMFPQQPRRTNQLLVLKRAFRYFTAILGSLHSWKGRVSCGIFIGFNLQLHGASRRIVFGR